MRNTSDPITKENSNVMNAQGGEKKVMKKILSVALSTAMAFSMFASVAFGDTAVSPQQQFDALKAKGIFNGYPDGTAGLDKDMTRAEFAKVITKLLGLKEITGTLSYTDKNYTAKNWAVPYIEAVTAAGIMEGKNVEKKIFDFNGKVTVSEMATILTRALDLEIPAETNNTAPAWAKGYVQAAINAGLVDANTNFTANASRELLVGAAYAIDEAQSLKVSSYTVTEGGKVVEFKISDGETVKVTLDKALEANKETEVKFTYKEKSFTEKVTYVVEAATKVQSASSVNLKEVDVAFDGKVDKATATDKNNYNVDNNTKGIKSITLLEDGKTARLLLNESSKFVQGTTYKVVVKNVKSSTGTVLPQGEVSFTSADNTLPTVTEVKALGTKVIKVTFSEPVVAPTSTNFQLDDKAFVGNVTPGANQREVILRDYTGSISVGAHKLTTSLVEDFAGLKSLSATTDFTVAADTEGPKVTEISATLEKVTVTFDEEIDPASVTNDSFYWKSGDSKKTGTVTQVASNVYEVQFSQANRLPGYESTLFVEVKDYSGNANAVKEHKINASVDLVRPQVVETTYGVDKTNQLTVRFDKAVYAAADVKKFTVKKDNDTFPVKSVTPADASNKIFYVEFYTPLEQGTYSLKIADIKDTTALSNTLVEYNGTFVATDVNAPSVFKSDYNNANHKVTLNFGREMDLASLSTKSNYYIEFKKGTAAAQTIALPVEVTVSPVNNGRSVVLTFPENIDGTAVTFGTTGSVRSITAAGVKSQTGQFVSLTPTVLSNVEDNRLAWDTVVQKDAKTFELTFSHVVSGASVGDFTINGTYPSSVTVKDNKVTLKTSDEYTGNSVIRLLTNNGVQTYAGNKVNNTADVVKETTNAIAPKVTGSTSVALQQTNRAFVLPFSTELATTFEGVTLETQIANDLIVRDLSVMNTEPLTPLADYTTKIVSVDGGTNNAVEVTLKKVYENPLSVQVSNKAQFIRAQADKTKVAGESSVYNVAGNQEKADSSIAVSNARITTAPVASVKAEVTNGGIKLVAKEGGVNTDTFTFAKTGVAGHVVTVNATGVTAQDDATVAEIVAELNKPVHNLKFTAEVVDGTTLPTGNFTFDGGSDATAGKVTIKLNKAVAAIIGQVEIGEGSYDADFVSATDKSTIVVDTKQAANIAGQSAVLKVEDVNGFAITLNIQAVGVLQP
ncbi:S-layer homology domain-containing protein [Paenibacillus sp. PK1-4R]|uniref:S-layer homology domain-containing protein n=1 Tax=Paenibacillus sp. PK1-4R TaxID=3049075 RepID=UPI0025A1A859|nr:S-layer homology domain-containing protein [Paenibacillus sp. PK1-4R]WJM07878.1 S-layer homology domain-containing protein [Paenibacillus sp. PK1-4R]